MRRFVSTAAILGLLLIALGVAGTAHEASAATPLQPRFVDNLDGTITDTQTGLMWETKTTTGGGPRDVNNLCGWSFTGRRSGCHRASDSSTRKSGKGELL